MVTTTTNATTNTLQTNHPQGLSPSEDLKDEPGDFIETNCHWRDCGLEFPTQVCKNILHYHYLLFRYEYAFLCSTH